MHAVLCYVCKIDDIFPGAIEMYTGPRRTLRSTQYRFPLERSDLLHLADKVVLYGQSTAELPSYMHPDVVIDVPAGQETFRWPQPVFSGRYIIASMMENLIATEYLKVRPDWRYTLDTVSTTCREWTSLVPEDSSDVAQLAAKHVNGDRGHRMSFRPNYLHRRTTTLR